MDNILESAIFADRRPSVALVFADSSITDADFDAGKEAAAVQIDFREYRVSFARPEAFIATLRQADSDGHDVICVVRGGGSGLEALENLDVLDCIAGMEAAVVTAVGHAADKVLSDDGPVYDDPSKPGENLKEYIVNGTLGDYVSVKNGQWIVRRSEIDWCDED